MQVWGDGMVGWAMRSPASNPFAYCLLCLAFCQQGPYRNFTWAGLDILILGLLPQLAPCHLVHSIHQSRAAGLAALRAQTSLPF